MHIPSIKTVEFERRQMDLGISCTANVWAYVPVPLTQAERGRLKTRIKHLLQERQAVLVAPCYVKADWQALADETCGCVSDSREMARFGRDHPARIVVVAGVQLMGDTAKIFSPHKRMLTPDLDATCSLDSGCFADEFVVFCDVDSDRTVVA
ncbi:MAG: quinolinate synthase [Patiriisocius sp.]|jgi:quinolinate synthase